MKTGTNQMHRLVSILVGCFIAIVAGLKLTLRLVNTYMLIDETFWYLLYLLLPQLINFGIAAVLFRGRRGPVAGCVFLVSALYTCAVSFFVVHMVNAAVDSFQLMHHFTLSTVFSGVFYVLVAMDCFIKKQVWLRWTILILPVAQFMAIMVVDSLGYIAMMDGGFYPGLLFYSLMVGMPGLVAELISGMGIGLSLLLQPKAPAELSAP